MSTVIEVCNKNKRCHTVRQHLRTLWLHMLLLSSSKTLQGLIRISHYMFYIISTICRSFCILNMFYLSLTWKNLYKRKLSRCFLCWLDKVWNTFHILVDQNCSCTGLEHNSVKLKFLMFVLTLPWMMVSVMSHWTADLYLLTLQCLTCPLDGNLTA